jgi:polysaccharide biosynthesis protein PelD
MFSTIDNPPRVGTSPSDDAPHPRHGARHLARHGEVPALALLELVGFFVIAAVIDHYIFGGTRFAGVQPHPFWIPIILLSVQYGTNAGLLAVAAAGAYLLAGNLPSQELTEDRFDYLLRLSAQPLLWLAAALVIGEIRSRQRRLFQNLDESLERVQAERDTIAAAYQELKSTKAALEIRIAGQIRTVAATCDAIVDAHTSGDAVLANAHQVVGTIIHPQKFSIFLLSGALLSGASNEGWEEDDRYRRSFGRDSGIYRCIVEQGRFLCAARAEDEVTLDGEGMLAGPLRDFDTGEVLGMLKIESIGFLDLNLDTVGIFKGVCEWIGMAMSLRRHVETLDEARFYSKRTNLLAPGVYARLAKLLDALGRRMGFQTLVVSVQAPKELASVPDGLDRFGQIVGGAVGEIAGPAALAFDRSEGDLNYTLLLPHRPGEPAFAVTERLRGTILRRLPADMSAPAKSMAFRAQVLEPPNV